jgi:AbrB family looped-hinge helix DNA binding protein
MPVSFATVTSKGQTTIPKDVREATGMKAGDRIHFAVLADGTIIVRVKNRAVRDLPIKTGKPRHVSVAQMNR